MIVAAVALLVVNLRRDEPGTGSDAAPAPPPVPAPTPSPAPRGEPAVDGNAEVVRVVDGDTVEVTIDGEPEPETVRLIGIDTPESVARDRPNECFGDEASARTADLLPEGTPVRLERDVEARDRYGRLLAYVRRSSDGLLVNHDLVAGGYAEASSYPPNTARDAELAAAQAEARRARAGLWGACGSADVPVTAAARQQPPTRPRPHMASASAGHS
jgi:micrococcal nuclease